MNIWFLIWLLLSGSLIFFAAWTIYILYMQKKSWRDFARKNQMRFTSGRLFSSPEINGAMEGYTVGVFASEHTTEDARGTRRMTAIEIGMQSRLPVGGVVASGGMLQLAQGLGYNEEVRPEHPGWKTAYLARSSSGNALEAYLTPARVEALTGLMKIKGAWVIYVFQEKETLLRLDTPDPLDTADKIEKMIQKMIAAAKTLELGDGEHANLERLAVEKRRKPKTVAIEVKESDIEAGGGLELED